MRAQEWAVYLHHSKSQPALVADEDSDSDQSPKGYMSPMKRSPSRCDAQPIAHPSPCTHRLQMRPPPLPLSQHLTCASGAGNWYHATVLRQRAVLIRLRDPMVFKVLAVVMIIFAVGRARACFCQANMEALL